MKRCLWVLSISGARSELCGGRALWCLWIFKTDHLKFPSWSESHTEETLLIMESRWNRMKTMGEKVRRAGKIGGRWKYKRPQSWDCVLVCFVSSWGRQRRTYWTWKIYSSFLKVFLFCMKESNWVKFPPEFTFIRKKEWEKNISADSESMLERNVYKTNENYSLMFLNEFKLKEI